MHRRSREHVSVGRGAELEVGHWSRCWWGACGRQGGGFRVVGEGFGLAAVVLEFADGEEGEVDAREEDGAAEDEGCGEAAGGDGV